MDRLRRWRKVTSLEADEPKRGLGIAQVLVAGLCFGFLGVFGRTAYARGLQPGELLCLRFSIASLVLLTVLLVTQPSKLKIGFKDFISCAGLGIFGYAVFSVCYFSALNTISASLTVMLLYLSPIFVAIGGWLAFGEKIPRAKIPALPTATLGLFFLVWGDFDSDFGVRKLIGLSLGLSSAVTYAIYILISSRLLRRVPPLVASAYQQLFTGITLSLIYLHDPARVHEIFEVAACPVLGLAFVCSVGGVSLFLFGLKHLKSWEAALLSLVEPVTAVLLAVYVLREKLSGWQILGAGLVFGSLVLTSLPRRATLGSI